MTALKGANAAPTSGSIRLVVRELGMARRAERLRVTELGYYSSESRPTREARRADHRGKPSRCLEYSKGRYPQWRTPQLVEYSPETDTSTGERRAWKLASGVRRGARGKGRCESYLACGLPYFALAFIGSKSEAEEIKRQLANFLVNELKLHLSEEKTLITHARSKAAKFLGYQITPLQSDIKQSLNKAGHKCRSINGRIGLRVPRAVLLEKCNRYKRRNKAVHRTKLLHESDYTIIATYQLEYRGIVNYYRLAYNLHTLQYLKWIMQQSLTKTLAAKHHISVKAVYDKYQTEIVVNDRTYKVLQATAPREGKEPLIATWGGIPLEWNIKATVDERIHRHWNSRSELEKRLLAQACEACGATHR